MCITSTVYRNKGRYHNGIIQKQCDEYNDQQIKQIQMKINAKPRKKLNFSTPKQEFYNLPIYICTCYWNLP